MSTDIMKNRNLKEEVQEQIKKAGKSFRKLNHKFDSDAIHDFRVEIKKIRAMLRLAGFAINQKDGMKIPKKLKSFYRTVGNIRSLQLHEKKIGDTVNNERDPSPDFYLRLLEGRKAVNIRRAKKKKRQLRGIKKEMEKLIRRLPKGIDAISARNFMEYELGRLKEIQSKEFPADAEFHEARKIMKDIFYNWAFIGPGPRTILPASIQKKEKMEGFIDRLGDYHDEAVSLEMFNDFPIDQSADSREQFEKIAGKWHEEKRQLHDKVMASMKAISMNGKRRRASPATRPKTRPIGSLKKQ